MSYADNDPLSPFNDPHRQEDAAPWPATPHSAADPHPTLVQAAEATSAIAGASRSAEGPSAGPWGKEPQIYGQPEPGLISPRETTASNGQHFEKPEPYLRVRITALDRNRRDILIRFDAQTNLSNFTGTTYRNISRSYAEFQRFYEQIVYSNPQTIIPALPLAQTSAPSDEEDDRLVKVMLQRWFSRVCEDPILLSDEELRSFIESDFGYQPMPRTRRKPASGFSLLGRRPPDEDEQLQQARFELTRLETQYIEAAKAVDKLSQSRKAMSFAHADMGNKLVDVSANEVHSPLAAAVRKMGRSWHTYADLDSAQEISDRVVLGDSLGYQGLNARSAKETLLQRTLVLEEYQDAVKNTINKRRNIERLKASSNIRPERVDDALEELEEATKVENHIHRRVEGISQNLHRGLHRHSRLAHEDLSAALIEHARMNLMYEKQLLRELESLRPDIAKAADAAPPVESLPAAAAIAPLAALNRSATMPTVGASNRPIITSGHFMPPPSAGQPQVRSLSQQAPGPIVAPLASNFMPPSQVVASPVTPAPTAPQPPNGAVSTTMINGPPSSSVSSFPRTSQFVSRSETGSPAPSVSTPGFPRTNQFASNPVPGTPSSAALTPGFPKSSQFVSATPTTPAMTPGFPKTNMFAPTGTPSTPGFPRTNQFVGVSSPLSASTPGIGGYNVLPRTSQFAPGAQNPPQRPMSAAGGATTNGGGSEQRPLTPNTANGMMSPGYQQLPSGPSTPVKAPVAGLQGQQQANPYQQPALPSQLQQQQLRVDPLGGGSRIIASQPSPSAPPTLPYTPTRMAASISGLPSRTNSLTSPRLGQMSSDPLMGGPVGNSPGGDPMSQSMFVTPTSATGSQYGPLGSAGLETGPLGGTVRGRPSATSTRSRLDAREAASKLANFL